MWDVSKECGMCPEECGMCPEECGMCPEECGMCPKECGMCPLGIWQVSLGNVAGVPWECGMYPLEMGTVSLWKRGMSARQAGLIHVAVRIYPI
jgi:hypothetical protein